MPFNLASFERDALELIEKGGYMDALTQLERLRTLIDEICRKLRVKVQRHGPGERRPKSGQSTMSNRSRSAAGDGPLPEVFNKLSQPTKRRQPGSEAEKENKGRRGRPESGSRRAGSRLAQAPPALQPVDKAAGFSGWGADGRWHPLKSPCLLYQHRLTLGHVFFSQPHRRARGGAGSGHGWPAGEE
jgi:hypothetical protein